MKTLDQRAWKGMAMEGWVARWYTRTRRKDMADFRREARTIAKRLNRGSSVLEVAPGSGFFAIELAKLGDFRITGLDISHTLATGLRSPRPVVALDDLLRASGSCAARNAGLVPDESALLGIARAHHGHPGCQRFVSHADKDGEHYRYIWSVLRTVPHRVDYPERDFYVPNDL